MVILSILASLVRAVLYGWVVALWKLIKLICDWLKKLKWGEQLPTDSRCVRIDHPSFVRPDPLIYSQEYLIAQGLAVTYDNPDIILFKAGVQVSSSSLEPSTTYDVQARIWNNSIEAPVVNMPVHLSYLDFGVGNTPIPIATGNVDVGVKGSASQPAFVTIPWTTPATPGHYCLQALLDPVDDLVPANNLGQKNTDVVATASPAISTFKLFNNTRRTRTYRFEIDAYEIPTLPKCKDIKPDRDARLERHWRKLFPIPNGFVTQIVPATPTLDPDQSVTITVTIEPPADFIGRQAINVNAFHEGGYSGGVTITCLKES